MTVPSVPNRSLNVPGDGTVTVPMFLIGTGNGHTPPDTPRLHPKWDHSLVVTAEPRTVASGSTQDSVR